MTNKIGAVEYSLVEFFVSSYKAGDKIEGKPDMWENPDPDTGLPRGKYIDDKETTIKQIGKGHWKRVAEQVYELEEDARAIWGIACINDSYLLWEKEIIGNDVFDGWWEEIFALAETDKQHVHIVTLWKSLYIPEEEDYYLEHTLLGAVGQQELQHLANKIK